MSPDDYDGLIIPVGSVNPDSYPSIRTDLRNAGGTVADQEVVVYHAVVTSRSPDDLPAFCAKIVEEFAEGTQEVAEAGATAA